MREKACYRATLGPRVRVDSREQAIEACARLASARTYLLPLPHTRQSLVLYLLLCYFFLPSWTYLASLLFYLAQRAIFLVFGAIEYFSRTPEMHRFFHWLTHD